MKITSGWGRSWHWSCVFKDEWAEMVREERTFQRTRQAGKARHRRGNRTAPPGLGSDPVDKLWALEAEPGDHSDWGSGLPHRAPHRAEVTEPLQVSEESFMGSEPRFKNAPRGWCPGVASEATACPPASFMDTGSSPSCSILIQLST